MPKENNNAVAEVIRNLRARLGLTQEQFAANVGVTWSTENRWEQGKSAPSPLATDRLAELRRTSGTEDGEG